MTACSAEWQDREMRDREGDQLIQLIRLREWNEGALSVAEFFGCRRATWQLRDESTMQAVTIYARKYIQGDCLILLPERGGHEYYFGYAGQFEGRITDDIPDKWPGVPIYFLHDTYIPGQIKQEDNEMTLRF
jgi:hypothetical protein